MNLYIPVEVKNRELHAKLLLAKRAAEQGFNVVLGRKNDLNELVPHMPPGIYLGLGAFENFRNFFALLKEKGFVVVVNEEEGLVTYSDSMYVDMRVSGATLDQIDKLFTWGDENQRVLSEAFPESSSKFVITGNPRFDLLKPENRKVYEPEMDEIREKYGRYVLICTSFSAINHFDPSLDYLASLIKKKTLRSEESIENFKRYCEVKKSILEGVLEAIPKLAKIDESVNIVIRPHPSENKDLYHEVERKFSNVHVDSRFSVHPWIISAEALIHHYCTTSIEALAVGTPRFALRLVKDTLSEKEVPFACSTECESVDSLIEQVAQSLQAGKPEWGEDPMRQEYSCYVSNISDHPAAESIVDRIQELAVSHHLDQDDGGLKTGVKMAAAISRYRVKGFLRWVLRRNLDSVNYINHKFIRLSVDEVRDVLSAFEQTNIKLDISKYAGNLINLKRSHRPSGD